MKKIKVAKLFVSCILLSLNVSGQLIVEKGQKVQVRTKSFANTLPTTVKKWDKMDEAQRSQHVEELNKRIEAGEVQPWMNVTSNLQIIDVNNTTPIGSYTVKAIDGTYEYQTTNYCAYDTMHLVRNADVVYSINDGDTLGLAVQGVQRIPNKLKVGDKLPSYRDYMITIPETWTNTVKESVKSFSYTTSKNQIGWMQDSYSGDFSFGEFKVTERHDVYTTISHKVKVTQNIQGSIIHYFVAKVTGEETIQLGAKSYPAFIIESESWSKGGLVVDYDAENERIEQQQQAAFEKLQAKAAKFSQRSGYTNDLGYVVKYLKEWFVPGMGIVKNEIHDQYGAIQTYVDVVYE